MDRRLPAIKTILILLLLWNLTCTAQAADALAFSQSVATAPVIFQGGLHKPVKIITIYPDQQASDYWRRNLVSMTARLKELNIRYKWTHFSSQPRQTRLQEHQLAEALKLKPDFLVINIDSPRIRKLLGRVLYRGTPKIIVANQTIPNSQWQDYPPLLYTGFDHEEGSRLLATHLFDTYGNDARYAIICGTRGQVSKLRTQGFLQVAKDRHASLPVVEFFTDQTPNRIYQAASDIINSDNQVDFIFCTTTDIALNTSRALKDLGRKKAISINGWGGGDKELEALQQGDLALTVMRMNDDSGVSIAEAIKFVLEDRQQQIPQLFCGNMKLLSAANLCQIEDLKKQAFRYSEAQ
ncbi:substrate-binding domain-containing protein [uncultured Desulfuromonas sp.]|uniref:substrate-binding domain-containing protein n=1 Tax=uncultured Desulfuromonas sp. TaxID=181013 RepID=UPI002AABF159|nr:substrate-binding domain-containing protein [uncultured Desulfuromonas sp.]